MYLTMKMHVTYHKTKGVYEAITKANRPNTTLLAIEALQAMEAMKAQQKLIQQGICVVKQAITKENSIKQHKTSINTVAKE